jgi:hypothetical protein
MGINGPFPMAMLNNQRVHDWAIFGGKCRYIFHHGASGYGRLKNSTEGLFMGFHGICF